MLSAEAQALVAAVADKIDWSCNADPDSGGLSLRHSEGARVLVRQQGGRLEWDAADWPRSRVADREPFAPVRPAFPTVITTGTKRTPGALAADVGRRLLGPYILEYRRQAAARDRWDRWAMRARAMRAELARRGEALGWRVVSSYERTGAQTISLEATGPVPCGVAITLQPYGTAKIQANTVWPDVYPLLYAVLDNMPQGVSEPTK